MDANENTVKRPLKEKNGSPIKTQKQLNLQIRKEMIDHVIETSTSDQPVQDILVYLESVFLNDDSRQFFGFSSMQEFHDTLQREMSQHSQKIKEQKSCKSVALVVQNVCKNCELCVVHKKCSLCSIAEWGRQMVQDSRAKDEKEKLKKYIKYLQQVQENTENENLRLSSTVKNLQVENCKLKARIFRYELEERMRTEEQKNLNQDMMSNFRELVETELQCVICSDLIIEANSLNCGHTFCEYCICEWRNQKESCPVCRTNISSANPVKILDGFVDKAFGQLDCEAAEKTRKGVKEERAILKRQRENENRQPFISQPLRIRLDNIDYDYEIDYEMFERWRYSLHNSVRNELDDNIPDLIDDESIPDLEGSFEDLPELVSNFSFPVIPRLVQQDSIEPEEASNVSEEDERGTDENSVGLDEDSSGSDEDLNVSDEDSSGSDDDLNGSEMDPGRSDLESIEAVEDQIGSEEDQIGSEEDQIGSVEDQIGSEEDQSRSEELESGSEEESAGLEELSSDHEEAVDLLRRRLADEILRSELYEDIPRHGFSNDLPTAILADFFSRMNPSSDLLTREDLTRRRQAEELLRRRLADEILRSELYDIIPRHELSNDLPTAILADFISRIEFSNNLPTRPAVGLSRSRSSDDMPEREFNEDSINQAFSRSLLHRRSRQDDTLIREGDMTEGYPDNLEDR